MPMSDEKILTALSADKREGVRLLFERYYRPLVLFAGELLEDQVEAEDIVQDFFVNLWEDDYLLRIKANALSSYMFVSVRNRCYTHLRRNDILRNKVDIADIDVAADSAAALSQEIVDRANGANLLHESEDTLAFMKAINRLIEKTEADYNRRKAQGGKSDDEDETPTDTPADDEKPSEDETPTVDETPDEGETPDETPDEGETPGEGTEEPDDRPVVQ